MVWQKRYFTEEEKRNAIRNSKAKYMLNKKFFLIYVKIIMIAN